MHQRYTELQTVILQEKQLVIILLVAEGNAYSFLMGSNLKSLSAEIEKPISWFLVDYDLNKDFVNTYNLSKIPTVLFFKDGQLVNLITGLISKTELSTKIIQAIGQG